ncbi:MAG: hypothetical protein KKB62_01515 [Nanoarchaeota archaeon]|nr:hypothetical protein [Nanoarchaeota archaeon]
MDEKYYKVRINPFNEKGLEESDRLLVIGGRGYLVTIEKSNIGNEPKIYSEVKTLASKLIEIEQIDSSKKFTIKIKQ